MKSQAWLTSLALATTSLVSAQRPAHPEFVHGEECLFCHRNDIGASWQKNAHANTVREKPGSKDSFTLGARGGARELRKAGYGKFAIREADGSWNETKFGDRCAGCHTTAVDGESKTFQYYGIDCYACHGAVNLEHTNDTSLILLSKKQRSDARKIASICGSCHLRGGQSKAKGFPYPYHFVPGDDLFADFQVDLSKVDDPALNPGDRHVYRNVRDALAGSELSCLSCHSVHQNSSDKHRRVLTSNVCLDCHFESGPKKNVKKYQVSSATCEY
ncbi:MAG: hypothetical protein NZV14_03310 [Bryobacteraceae bacterium]|nr:hypothetical protein [Bryobacteraceae bacterium]MDW8377164.1 multiheme c-type cytochrome [Bryobacterales bacterium]